jgi:hypothetical protein
MKKKIFILSLAALLFVSTTSLPVSVHLCRMAKTTKTCTCKMMKNCKMHCGLNNSNKTTGIHPVKNNCCSTKTIDTSLKIEYLSQQNNTNDNIQTLVVILTNNPFESILQLRLNKKYYQNVSPPLLTSNNLYLNNSVLLI